MREPIAYYTKNKKVYHYTPTQAELDDMRRQRARTLYAMRKAEEEAQEQYETEHKGGYCPKCFLLRPTTGICPTCD